MAGSRPDDVPSLEEMRRYNSAELQLPEVSGVEPDLELVAPSAYNWSALEQRGGQRRP